MHAYTSEQTHAHMLPGVRGGHQPIRIPVLQSLSYFILNWRTKTKVATTTATITATINATTRHVLN